MSLSNSLIDPRAVVVTDASVVINLNATERARDIVKALPNRFVVTENALAELTDGMIKGHDDAHRLQILMDEGIFDLVGMGETAGRIYETLVGGSAAQTLDDGEAATVAYACEVRGIAMIDERKARSLCANKFLELPFASTVDLLLDERIAFALGGEAQIDVVHRALKTARMHVPHDQVNRIISLIGKERAASCPSLPKWARSIL